MAVWLGPIRRQPAVFVLIFLLTVVVAFYLELSLPFARSLIACDDAGLSRHVSPSLGKPSADALRDEGEEKAFQKVTGFSGSANCADKKYVVRDGQRVFGVALSVKLISRTAAGPYLGALADKHGRKPLLLLGIAGLLVAVFLGVIAAAIGSGVFAIAILVLSGGLQGVTSIFGALAIAIGADVTKGREEEQPGLYAAISVIQAVGSTLGLVIAVAVEKLNLSNYMPVWCVLCLALGALLIGTLRLVGETLDSDPNSVVDKETTRSDSASKSWTCCSQIQENLNLLRNRFLQQVLVAAALLCGGFACGSIFASFTMAVYGWEQGDFQVWILGFGTAGLTVIAFAERCITRFGPAHVLASCLLIASLDTLLRLSAPLKAPLGPTFLLGSCLLDVFAGPAIPAFNTICARRFGTHDQAKTHALIGMCINLSTALASPVYAWLFDPKSIGYVPLVRPFMLGSLLVISGSLLLSIAVWPSHHEERRKKVSYAEFDDSEACADNGQETQMHTLESNGEGSSMPQTIIGKGGNDDILSPAANKIGNAPPADSEYGLAQAG